MKKLFVLFILSSSLFLNAQENYSYYGYEIEFSMPKIKDYENFYFTEWELNPTEMPNKLSDIEQLQKDNKNPYLTYQIEKSKELTTVIISANHQKFSEATYKSGLLHGKKTIFHANGVPFQEIEFKNGKVDGVCKIYNKDYDLILETNYKNNLKNGLRKFTNGRRRKETLEGNFVNGNLVGNLKLHDEYNRMYLIPNDFKKGKVQCFYNNILAYEYDITNQQINGIAKQFDIKTGTVIAKIPYLMGKKHGFYESYDSKGELINKINYKLGKKIGDCKQYSSDKKLMKEEYYDDNGLKIGTWREYDKNGQLYTEQEYKNDSLNGTSKRFSKGILQEISEYKNNKREGLSKHYKSGTSILTSDVYYSNDKFYKEIVYYDSGKIFSTRDINPNTKEVSVKYYNPDGTFFHENKFLDDFIAVGLNKTVEKENDSLIVRTETLYDGKKNRIKQTSYNYKKDGSYTEYNFRNNTFHGESKSFNAATNETKITYYYETNKTYKIVTKEEFEKLTAAEKK